LSTETTTTLSKCNVGQHSVGSACKSNKDHCSKYDVQNKSCNKCKWYAWKIDNSSKNHNSSSNANRTGSYCHTRPWLWIFWILLTMLIIGVLLGICLMICLCKRKKKQYVPLLEPNRKQHREIEVQAQRRPEPTPTPPRPRTPVIVECRLPPVVYERRHTPRVEYCEPVVIERPSNLEHRHVHVEHQAPQRVHHVQESHHMHEPVVRNLGQSNAYIGERV